MHTHPLVEECDLGIRECGIGPVWIRECDENLFQEHIESLENTVAAFSWLRQEECAIDTGAGPVKDDGHGEGTSGSTLARDENPGHLC